MSKVKISGKKMIHRKVKSFEGEDVGKIESISADYVEVKHDKTRFFIPKLHIKDYDKDNLYILLSMDEIKKRYERDTPPLSSEIRNNSIQNNDKVAGYHEVIPFMAKEPDLELKGKMSGTTMTIPWENVIHKHVRTSDNVDIGDVDRIGNEFIIVREGVAKVHLYYIPKPYITNYDGSSIWIDVPSGLVSLKFEREHEPTKEEIDILMSEIPD